ncbi:MAG: hypothetical protein WC670_10080 [Pseudolabrys sp.]
MEQTVAVRHLTRDAQGLAGKPRCRIGGANSFICRAVRGAINREQPE